MKSIICLWYIGGIDEQPFHDLELTTASCYYFVTTPGENLLVEKNLQEPKI